MDNGQLPNGWSYAGLENISDLDKSSIKRGPFGSALKKAFFVKDGYKVYEQQNVIKNDFTRGTYFIDDEKYEELKAFTIKANDILMSCAGTVGKLAIVPDDIPTGVINQALFKLTVHPDIDLQYFFKLFSYKIEEILRENTRGSAMVNLTSVKDLKEVKFPIAPINEQKRIVKKIDKLVSNLDKSDQHLVHLEKQLKRYRQSVLKSAFEGELTREWRENQTDLESADELLEKIKAERIEYIEQEIREKFKDKTEKWLKDKIKKTFDKFYNGLKDINNIEKPFDIPANWKWVQWEQILKYTDGSFKRGPFGSSLKKAFFVKDSTYKVYEQYCPINDDCSFERYYISEDKFLELKSFEVKEKDYLISCSGSIGKITQIPQKYKNGVINQALLRVRINDSFYLDKFFITLFRSRFFQDSIIDNSTGSAMINVKGVKELKALPLPMLSINEQKKMITEIERHFSIIDKLEAVVQKSIKESKRLRQSILKQAFEGKLIEQDPSDESATILLEKIAKAKEEYKKEMKKGKKK